MTNNMCPICKSNLNDGSIIGRPGNQYFICPRCGDFYLSETALATLPHKLDNEDKIAVLSHAVRKMQREKSPPIFIDEQIDRILETNKMPTPKAQADNLILWLGDYTGPGEKKRIASLYHQSEMNEGCFKWIIEYLQKRELIGILDAGSVVLSFEGWEYYEQLKKGVSESRKAFMAMKFNIPELERIVNDYFKPAVLQSGFELVLLTDEPRAGLIDDRLRVEIRTSRFLIADLTHENESIPKLVEIQ